MADETDETKPEAQVPTGPPGPVGNGPPIVIGDGPPILILGPVANSLSPSGGTVGGSGFTLTVNGARFVKGSTVLWNRSARATTFVSSTQLTASILASDIATVGSAAVAVVNPAPGGTSNELTFSIIPDITVILSTLNEIAQNFTTLVQFTALQPGLIQTLSDLKTYLTNENSTISQLQSQLSDAQTKIANLTGENANLNTQVAQQQATIAQLQTQLAAAKNQTASPLDVAKSFKAVVDQIHQTALSAGGVQATLANMSVQLKALVSVQATQSLQTGQSTTEAVLVFPDPTALPDPNALSTVTFSFSAIPNLRAAASAGPGNSSSSSPSGTSSPPEGPRPTPKTENGSASKPTQEV
jgi:hypothetical protein